MAIGRWITAWIDNPEMDWKSILSKARQDDTFMPIEINMIRSELEGLDNQRGRLIQVR